MRERMEAYWIGSIGQSDDEKDIERAYNLYDMMSHREITGEMILDMMVAEFGKDSDECDSFTLHSCIIAKKGENILTYDQFTGGWDLWSTMLEDDIREYIRAEEFVTDGRIREGDNLVIYPTKRKGERWYGVYLQNVTHMKEDDHVYGQIVDDYGNVSYMPIDDIFDDMEEFYEWFER